MNNLTEKWKNKELPHGAFYVKVFTGAILVDFFDATILKFVRCEDDIEEVIDYVPCYSNFQEYKKQNTCLKELLKDCRFQIDDLLDTYIGLSEELCYEHGNLWSEEFFKKENKDVYELLTKINEVLK